MLFFTEHQSVIFCHFSTKLFLVIFGSPALRKDHINLRQSVSNTFLGTFIIFFQFHFIFVIYLLESYWGSILVVLVFDHTALFVCLSVRLSVTHFSQNCRVAIQSLIVAFFFISTPYYISCFFHLEDIVSQGSFKKYLLTVIKQCGIKLCRIKQCGINQYDFGQNRTI